MQPSRNVSSSQWRDGFSWSGGQTMPLAIFSDTTRGMPWHQPTNVCVHEEAYWEHRTFFHIYFSMFWQDWAQSYRNLAERMTFEGKSRSPVKWKFDGVHWKHLLQNTTLLLLTISFLEKGQLHLTLFRNHIPKQLYKQFATTERKKVYHNNYV